MAESMHGLQLPGEGAKGTKLRSLAFSEVSRLLILLGNLTGDKDPDSRKQKLPTAVGMSLV